MNFESFQHDCYHFNPIKSERERKREIRRKNGVEVKLTCINVNATIPKFKKKKKKQSKKKQRQGHGQTQRYLESKHEIVFGSSGGGNRYITSVVVALDGVSK
jgi:hypothetical protein